MNVFRFDNNSPFLIALHPNEGDFLHGFSVNFILKVETALLNSCLARRYLVRHGSNASEIDCEGFWQGADLFVRGENSSHQKCKTAKGNAGLEFEGETL